MFFYGYLLSHLPGGIVADLYGGRHVVGAAVLGPAIMNGMIPLIAFNLDALISVRFFQGLLQGPLYPAINSVLSKYTPPNEKGRLVTITSSGVMLGHVLGLSATAALTQKYGWQIPFFMWSGICVLWYGAWLGLGWSTPRSNILMSEEERDYIEKSIGAAPGRPSIPWVGILSNVALYMLIIGQLGHDWIMYAVQIDIPKYLYFVIKFDIESIGMLASLPYILMFIVTLLGAVLTDWIEDNEKMKTATQRKLFTAISAFGPAAGLMAASYSCCDKVLVMVFYNIGMSTVGFYYNSLKLNGMDLSPTFAGIVMALVNGTGAVTGAISPLFVSVFVHESGNLFQWRNFFWLSAAVAVSTTCVYVAFGDASIQKFDPLYESRIAQGGGIMAAPPPAPRIIQQEVVASSF